MTPDRVEFEEWEKHHPLAIIWDTLPFYSQIESRRKIISDFLNGMIGIPNTNHPLGEMESMSA